MRRIFLTWQVAALTDAGYPPFIVEAETFSDIRRKRAWMPGCFCFPRCFKNLDELSGSEFWNGRIILKWDNFEDDRILSYPIKCPISHLIGFNGIWQNGIWQDVMQYGLGPELRYSTVSTCRGSHGMQIKGELTTIQIVKIPSGELT